MQSRLVFLVLVMAVTGSLFGQSVRISPRLQIEMMVDSLAFRANGTAEKDYRRSDYVFLGVKMDQRANWDRITDLGGHINTRKNSWGTVQLPKSAVAALIQLPGLREIYYDPSPRPLNDKAIQHVQADKVHAGIAPLPQGYSGKDVVVGIIDTGIDYLHDDFRDPTDSKRSRIAYIWDQWAEEGEKPEDFSYGAEWTREQIEAELVNPDGETLIHMDTFPLGDGHGTHVSGTAAGNQGIAYEADLIVVATIFTEASILDAAHYILKRAEEMSKPCVINLSLGDNLHAHDGTDFLSEGLSQLLDGTEGKAIVAAAGNEGNKLRHWGAFTLSEDSASVYYAGGDGVQAYLRIPKSVLPTLELDIAVDTAKYENGRLKSIAEIGRTGYINLADLGTIPFYQPFFSANDSLAADLFIFNLTQEEKDYAEIYVVLDEGWNSYNWSYHRDVLELFRFYVRGSGSFHAWFRSAKLFSYTSPEEAGRTEPAYQPPNSSLSIYSPCDGRNVLCVGAYTNQPDWVDFEGKSWPWPPEEATGDLASFSSTGPTMDNRIKPEIVAPGKVVASAAAHYNEYSIYLTQTMPPLSVRSGTSMSAPVVTGTIALMLQENSALTYEEIINLITSTAIEDDQSLSRGELPNGYWGYGKLNAYKAMLSVLGITPTENQVITPTLLSVFPNPARQQVNLVFAPGLSERGEIRIRDLNGREVQARQSLYGNTTMQLDVSGLPPGMYLLEWTSGRQRVVEKLILHE